MIFHRRAFLFCSIFISKTWKSKLPSWTCVVSFHSKSLVLVNNDPTWVGAQLRLASGYCHFIASKFEGFPSSLRKEWLSILFLWTMLNSLSTPTLLCGKNITISTTFWKWQNLMLADDSGFRNDHMWYVPPQNVYSVMESFLIITWPINNLASSHAFWPMSSSLRVW